MSKLIAFALLCIAATAQAQSPAAYRAECVRQMTIAPPCLVQIDATANPGARLQLGGGLSVPLAAYAKFTSLAKQSAADPGYLAMCELAEVEMAANPASDEAAVVRAFWTPTGMESQRQQPATVPAGALALAGVLACSALLFSLGSARREALGGHRA